VLKLFEDLCFRAGFVVEQVDYLRDHGRCVAEQLNRENGI
jgi:hypothetical protein